MLPQIDANPCLKSVPLEFIEFSEMFDKDTNIKTYCMSRKFVDFVYVIGLQNSKYSVYVKMHRKEEVMRRNRNLHGRSCDGMD